MVLVGLGILGLLGFFAATLLGRSEAPPPSAGPEIPAAFVAYVWSGGAKAEFDAAWQGGTAPPMLQTREIAPPSLIGGLVHHHVVWVLPGRRQRVSQEAWFRPSEDGSSWLCARRRIGGDVLDIEPPLPILKAPLEAKAGWDWEGLVGGRPASARFDVLTAADGLLVIRQTTTLKGEEENSSRLAGKNTVTRTYQAGRGLIREEGDFPYEPRGDSTVVTRRDASPSPQPQ